MKKISVIILMLFMTLLAGCDSGRRTLQVGQYVFADISGLSGRAQGKVYLDTAGIYAALAADSTDEEKAQYSEFVNTFSISTDVLENLGNGNRITVTVTYNTELADKLKINVTDFVKAIDIEGLDEGREIDLFKDLEVEVTGIAPYASVTLNNKSDDAYIKKLKYSVEGRTDNLRNGDTILISCDMDPKEAELYYYYTDVTTTQYTVEGLDAYIYDSSDIDPGVLGEIAGECVRTVYDETEDTTTRMMYIISRKQDYLYQDNNERVQSINLRDVIFMYRKSPGNSPYENILYFVFEAVIANNDYEEPGYFIFEYTNAIRGGNGNLIIGRNNPELRYICGKNYDELYSELTREIEYQYSTEIINGITINKGSD